MKDEYCIRFELHGLMKCPNQTVSWVHLLVMRDRDIIAIATELWNLLLDILVIVLHYSLRDNGLTDTGALALARALQENKSLEELK